MNPMTGPDLGPGDRVVDREAEQRDRLVVLAVLGPCDKVRLLDVDGEPTVAGANPDYPADASAVECAFPAEMTREIGPGWRDFPEAAAKKAWDRDVTRYTYPLPRLRPLDSATDITATGGV